jgi:hypothetical protein
MRFGPVVVCLPLIRIHTGDFHVKRTPDKTHLSVLRIYAGRHARQTDHGGHGVAMRRLRGDVQGQTCFRQVSPAQTFVTAASAESRLNASRRP